MSPKSVIQATLFGNEEPSFDSTLTSLRRRALPYASWIDQAQGFLAGHQPIFDLIHDDTRWHSHNRVMYDRTIDVPRLTASLPRDGPGHSAIREIADALGERYDRPFDLVTLALYRNGSDSIAWHRDKCREDRRGQATIATLSLGESRSFLVRPHGGGTSVRFSAGWGDLLVMGGACQLYWEHSIPKTRAAGPRISVMFRSTADFLVS